MTSAFNPGSPLAKLENRWLHLDVMTGCAGDMLCAALLDLGISTAVIRDGLSAVGLHPAVGPRSQRTKRNGVAALHLMFVDRHGKGIEGTHADPPSAFVDLSSMSKRRFPVAKMRGRTPPVVSIAGASAPSDTEDGTLLTLHNGGTEKSNNGPREVDPSDVTRFLSGDTATGAELIARLARGRLAPVAAALSQKALRRLLDGLAAVNDCSRDDVVLDGPAAVDVLCDIVSFCCLIEALDPLRVTSSIVGVSTAQVRGGAGPEPWVMEVLKGIPTKERAQQRPACTPTGAALIWAVTHLYGPRLESVVDVVGVGAGTKDIRGVSNVTRAFVGEDAAASSPAVSTEFSAILSPATVRADLVQGLISAGASALFFSMGAGVDGSSAEKVSGVCSNADEDSVLSTLLLEGFADAVMFRDAQLRRAKGKLVTVPVGSTQKQEHVDLLVTAIAGEKARIRCEPQSVIRAAKRLGWEPQAVRDDALLAFERLAPDDVEAPQSDSSS